MSSESVNPRSKSFGIELRLDHAIEGVKTNWSANVPQVFIRGESFTPTQLVSHLGEIAESWKKVREAHSIIRQFTQDKPRLTDEAKEFLADLKSIVSGLLGRENEKLTRFGFKPHKRRRERTVEEKTISAAKSKLTREKRGTKGKRQREKLKAGDVEVTIPREGDMTMREVPRSEPPPSEPPEEQPPEEQPPG